MAPFGHELSSFVRSLLSLVCSCGPRKEVVVAASKKYPDELVKRAVRLYRESDLKPAIRWLAGQLNVHPEVLLEY